MATKSKAELLEEARSKNLDVSEDNTVAELQEALKNSSDNSDANARTEEQVREDSRRSDAGADEPTPESARTNGERDGRGVRTPQVGEEVTTSFDERTSAVQPFILEDGTQDNGARDLEEPEGARRTTSREGNQSTVEDTKDAIDKGVIPASDQPEVEETPPQNPVK